VNGTADTGFVDGQRGFVRLQLVVKSWTEPLRSSCSVRVAWIRRWGVPCSLLSLRSLQVLYVEHRGYLRYVVVCHEALNRGCSVYRRRGVRLSEIQTSGSVAIVARTEEMSQLVNQGICLAARRALKGGIRSPEGVVPPRIIECIDGIVRRCRGGVRARWEATNRLGAPDVLDLRQNVRDGSCAVGIPRSQPASE